MKKHKFLSCSLFFSSLLIFSSLTIISCSNISTTKNNSILNFENLNYEYLRAFRDEEYTDLSLFHNIWIKDEKIYEDEKFKFYVEGEKNNLIYIDLFSQEIKKWYLIEVNLDDYVLNKNNKKEIENFIVNKVIEEFEKMVVSKFTTDSFFLPLTSENYSTTINNDGHCSFKSSWGVWNSSKKEVNFEFKIDQNLVRNQMLSQNNKNAETVVVDSVKINKLYYLPLIEVLDPPVGECYWTQKQITFDLNIIESDLNNNKNKLKLPQGADKGQEWYKWFFDAGKILWDSVAIGLSIAGTVLPGTSLAGAIMSWVSSSMSAISLGDSIRSLVIDNVENEYKNNKPTIDDFANVLISSGYVIDLEKYLNLNEQNVINVWADIEYRAKATACFGDKTQARIYEATGLATTTIEWREYVKL